MLLITISLKIFILLLLFSSDLCQGQALGGDRVRKTRGSSIGKLRYDLCMRQLGLD